MINLGDIAEDTTVYIPFNTLDSNGASVTVTNLANTDVHVHKDGGLTQRNNAAGVTVSINYDGITGNHLIAIDTSDNTVAGFWVTGSDYAVRLEGITVDSQTLNVWVACFSIENRSTAALTASAIADAVFDEALSGHLTEGTAGAKLDAADKVGR